MEAYGRRAARWGCKISSHTRRAMRVNFVVCRINVWRFLASSLARPSLRVNGDRPWTSWRVMWPRGPESWTRREIRHNVRCHLAANCKRLPFFTSFQCSGILQLLCINLHHCVKRWSEVCNITLRPRNDWILSEWASSTTNPLRQRRQLNGPFQQDEGFYRGENTWMRPPVVVMGKVIAWMKTETRTTRRHDDCGQKICQAGCKQ